MFKNVVILLLSLLSLFSLILNLYLFKNEQSQNIVTVVVDGDTFQLMSGKRIRLMGVDAPEYNRLGIFSLCKELPNPSCNIKGNIDKNTYKKFYHLPGCKQYNQIIIDKDLGEKYFCTEQEASKAGFIKASGCP